MSKKVEKNSKKHTNKKAKSKEKKQSTPKKNTIDNKKPTNSKKQSTNKENTQNTKKQKSDKKEPTKQKSQTKVTRQMPIPEFITNIINDEEKLLKFKKYAVISVVVFIVLVCFIAIMCKPQVVNDKPNLFKNLDTEIANGLDISHYNGEVNWQELKENADFVILRAGYRGFTQGNLYEDDLFKTNLKKANEVDIPVGVYFYTQATTKAEAKKEANYVLSLIKGYDVSLPIFIDYEYAFDENDEFTGRLYNANLTKDEASEVINAFCDKINKAGHYAGVYASSYVYIDDINTKNLNKNAFIWVADYGEKLRYKGNFDIWQYTKKGKCTGVYSKYTDLDRWYLS